MLCIDLSLYEYSEISITIDSSNITNALPGCSYANKGAMSEDVSIKHNLCPICFATIGVKL